MSNKKVLLLFVGICLCLSVLGQDKTSPANPRRMCPPLRESVDSKDENHEAERYSDCQMKENWHRCYTLNGEFVGPHGIGIDHYAYEVELDTRNGLKHPFVVKGIGRDNDSLVVDKMLSFDTGPGYYIRGHYISRFINYVTSEDVHLMTLEEIKEKYCPQVKKNEKVLYMINKFFIIEDVDLYKIAEDFIFKVETLYSGFLFPISSCIEEDFFIIRIFTLTHHNWHPRGIGD